MEEPKLQLLPGGTDSSCTFVMSREDHTLGNALRFVCMRDARTQFCGYSMPHPSEQRINVRVQTKAGATSAGAFGEGCRALVTMTEVISAAFEAAVERGPEVGAGGEGAVKGGGGGGRRHCAPCPTPQWRAPAR